MCLEFLDASFFLSAASIIERDSKTNIYVIMASISSTAELCLHLEERNQTHIIQSNCNYVNCFQELTRLVMRNSIFETRFALPPISALRTFPFRARFIDF
jgi:hypothetical protein